MREDLTSWGILRKPLLFTCCLFAYQMSFAGHVGAIAGELMGSSNVYSIQQDDTKPIVIKGVVKDKHQNYLPGVAIRVKGYPLGGVSDENGKFEFTLPPMKERIVLEFSFIGMETKTVTYKGQKELNIILEYGFNKLDEVVVTGYQQLNKESFTGNATIVKRDELLKANNKNVISALQAFDPSFRIRENTLFGSDPNALPEINIRGESSIAMEKGLDVEQQRRNQRTNLQNNPNMPIFILDGFEVNVQKIYDMDVNRIESMTILKDAAATAMYGSRAANGVVVVTTVAPKPGEMQINYNFTGGVDLPDLSDYNLCNAAQKLEVERLAGLYTAADPATQILKEKEYYSKLRNIQRGVDTDWLSQPLRNVFNHTHSLNMQGGVESIRYNIDLNYDSNQGVMKGSQRSRTGAGFTLDYRSKKWLQILNQITYSRTSSEDSPYGNFSDYGKLQPYITPFDEDGKYARYMKNGDILTENPLWKVHNLKSYSGRGKTENFTNNLSVNIFFGKGFQFKGQFSISKDLSKTESFIDPADTRYDNVLDEEKGSLTRNTSDAYNWNLNAMFYYNNSLGKHFINATAGVNMTESSSETSDMAFTGFQLGNMDSPAFAAKQPNKSMVSSTKSRLVGFLGSINYSYDNIYLFDGSVRLDGSSQFGSDKRFAPFWSTGVGINIHNYEFMRGNPIINILKLRTSYGSTGKVNFPAYSAITTYKIDSDNWYFTGPATALMGLGNPRLTWETTKTWDAGITIALFDNRFYIDASYYHKQTDDLIDAMSVQTSSGFPSYNVNSGSVLNEGFEIDINATVFRNKDWMVTLNGNLASNKNTIKSIGAEMNAYNQEIIDAYNNMNANSSYGSLLSTPVIQYYEGASTTAIYAVRSDGIDPATGKERFIKKNGMPTYDWNANDQVVVGDTSPDAQGSFGINVGYKGFYLNASFLYQWGGQTYNETLLNKVENANIQSENVDLRVLTDRWKNVGDNAPFYDLGSNHETRPTSRFVQDYNFLRFSSLSLGYDFSPNLIAKLGLKNLGIRFNANDLAFWSTVKEERGLSYPYSKTFNFTINIGI